MGKINNVWVFSDSADRYAGSCSLAHDNWVNTLTQ
jgi:hypothetical protein